MTAYEDQVRESFKGLDTDELLERLNSGSMTDEAAEIAKIELDSRGVGSQSIREKVIQESPPQSVETSNFFGRAWSGRERLWKAFWLLGWAVSVITGALAASRNPLLILAIGIPLNIYWWICVWRCSFRSSHWFWGILARVWIVLIGIMLLVSLIRD